MDKYGPPMPEMLEELSFIPIAADDVCPNQNLTDIAIEYRFLNEKLAALFVLHLSGNVKISIHYSTFQRSWST